MADRTREFAAQISDRLSTLKQQEKDGFADQRARLEEERLRLVARQKAERAVLTQKQTAKMIRRETLESDFEAIARGLVPAPEICSAAQAILSDAWDRRAALQQQRRKSLQARVAEIDTETGKLLKKIIEVESRTVISTLEKRIDALEAEKLTIGEKMEQSGKPLKPFGQVFRTSMAFLENPFRLWACGRYEDRRILLKFAFAEKLAYKRGEGFQTPKKSSLFNILEENLGGLKRLAERRRFELLCGLSPTIRFRVGAVMTASVPLRSTAIIAASACFRSS